MCFFCPAAPMGVRLLFLGCMELSLLLSTGLKKTRMELFRCTPGETISVQRNLIRNFSQKSDLTSRFSNITYAGRVLEAEVSTGTVHQKDKWIRNDSEVILDLLVLLGSVCTEILQGQLQGSSSGEIFSSPLHQVPHCEAKHCLR